MPLRRQHPLAHPQHFLCRAHHPPSGRTMEVHTTQPGLQFYTGNNLDGSLKGKGAATYPKHSAFCLETQNWPDAVNKVSHSGPVASGPFWRAVRNAQDGEMPWGYCSRKAVGTRRSLLPPHPHSAVLIASPQPHFPSPLLLPGEEYNHTTWLCFGTA